MELLSCLVDTVFTDGNAGAMSRFYERFFCEENRENHLVYVDGGQVVSHVGMIQHWARLAGCTVRVGCIGSVATANAYRNQGLATRLFQAVCEKGIGDGVDFLLISGGRGLYRRAGAVAVGCDLVTEVEPEALAPLRRTEMELAETTESELAGCAAAYAAKPTHFIRTDEEWGSLLALKTAMCRDIRILSVRREGLFRGYCVATHVDNAGFCSIIEFAGDGFDLAAALPLLMQRLGAKTVKLRLQQGDVVLRTQLERLGADMQPVPTRGTLLLLRFPELMERLRPLWEQRIGAARARALSFRTYGEDLVFADGPSECRADIAQATAMIFGHPEAPPAAGGSGVWADVFPAPTLWYGLNYV